MRQAHMRQRSAVPNLQDIVATLSSSPYGTSSRIGLDRAQRIVPLIPSAKAGRRYLILKSIANML